MAKKPKKKSFFARFFGSKPADNAPESIPFKQIYRDGTCRVNDRLYTRTIQYQDIAYSLCNNEDKAAIFENYCDFLNYFDSSISIQLTFLNQKADLEEYRKSITINEQDDEYNDIRREFVEMLKEQLAKGNNGLARAKFLTYGIEADNLMEARQRLERIESDVLMNFKVLGVRAYPLNGMERLALLHRCFHGNNGQKFHYSWDAVAKTGLGAKCAVAPDSFNFSDGSYFRMGRTWGATSFVQINASELSDKVLTEFLELDSDQIINIHLRSINQNEAIKKVKGKLSDLDGMKVSAQMKATRTGYDMDLLPPDLVTFGKEAESLLESLQNRNERMFLATILVTNLADKRRKLDNNIFQASGIAQKNNCELRRLEYQQEPGLMSSLPLGCNQIEIERGLTTSSAGIFVPFSSCELFQRGEGALYYGLNAMNNTLIMADRKRLKNPNGLILGVPGAGKSFAAKREIANIFLCTNDDIIILDPEGEYISLVRHLGGQVIDLSPTSQNYVNPLDINLNYSEDENPVSLKSDFVLSLCELIVGGKDGLEPVEKTVIDRCVRLVYQPYFQHPDTAQMPILEDLYKLLRQQPEPEAQRIAAGLELYTEGSLNLFNHRTNVDVNNRLVCYNIKGLGNQLKKIGMQIVQDQVWGRVSANREARKTTRYYVDEFHLLLKEPQTASYSVGIWKRFRKWSGIPTGITQNIKDLLSSREIENIFENSDFILMLCQAGGDREILAQQLGISPQQLAFITNSGEGEGLLFYGDVIVPFVDHFPRETQLYRMMTTKPDEMLDAA